MQLLKNINQNLNLLFMKNKLRLFKMVLIGCIILPYITMAQKNAVKLNLFGLAFKNVSLQYERSINDNISGALGVSYMLGLSPPEINVSGADTAVSFSEFKLSGFSVTPEFRFYPGHEGLRGFYLAPYFRFAQYKSTAPYRYTESDGTKTELNTDLTFNSTGGGLMIGTHFLIGENFSVDWWIIGFSYAPLTSKVKVTGTLKTDSYDDVRGAYASDVEGFGKVTSEVGDDYAQIVVKKGIPGVRTGLTLGYAF